MMKGILENELTVCDVTLAVGLFAGQQSFIYSVCVVCQSAISLLYKIQPIRFIGVHLNFYLTNECATLKS